MDERLGDIPVTWQEHPGLSPETPFELLEERYDLRTSAFTGDVHRVLQITVVLDGAMELVTADADGARRYGPGELWWADGGEPHAYRAVADGTRVLCVNIMPEALGACGAVAVADFRELFRLPPRQRYCPAAAGCRDLRRRVLKWLSLYRDKPQEWKGRLWLSIHLFFLEALGALRTAGTVNAATREYERIRPALELLRQTEGRGPPPSQGGAAAACALSISRFAWHFRLAMGMSYGRYAARQRLAAAARDVADGRGALKEIARRHGFCDASGFNNAFKRLFRCTPGRFKPGR